MENLIQAVHIMNSVLSALFLLLAILILSGKFDWLMAGYNTKAKEKLANYNIKRLRLVVGCVLLLVAGSMLSTVLGIKFFAFRHIALLYIAIGLFLAHTWAKKKK